MKAKTHAWVEWESEEGEVGEGREELKMESFIDRANGSSGW